MDTWGSAGSDALIFYGDQGRLIKRYEKAEGVLIAPSETRWVERTISSFWWSRGAHAQFTADGKYFWIWLRWGRVMMFDVTTGERIDAEALRLKLGQGRAMMLKTAEFMADSSLPLDRIAAARLAGWLNGRAVFPLLQKLARDPYHEDTGQLTAAEDPWGRFAASSPLFLRRRVYPVRRAAAEEIHIKFGQANTEGVEDLIPM